MTPGRYAGMRGMGEPKIREPVTTDQGQQVIIFPLTPFPVLPFPQLFTIW